MRTWALLHTDESVNQFVGDIAGRLLWKYELVCMEKLFAGSMLDEITQHWGVIVRRG